MSGIEGVMAVSIEEWNAKNNEIEQLRAEAADRTKKVECLWALNDARKDEIVHLRKRLEAAHEHVEAADREVTKLTAAIAEYNYTSTAKNAEIAALQNENKQLRYGDASEQWSRGWVRTDFIHEIERLRADTERLWADNKQLRADIDEWAALVAALKDTKP